MQRLRLRRRPRVVDDQNAPPTTTEKAFAVSREALVLVLAFVAGSGTYFAAITASPLRWQDFAGALAAGATACLMRLFPSAGPGGRNDRG